MINGGTVGGLLHLFDGVGWSDNAADLPTRFERMAGHVKAEQLVLHGLHFGFGVFAAVAGQRHIEGHAGLCAPREKETDLACRLLIFACVWLCQPATPGYSKAILRVHAQIEQSAAFDQALPDIFC